MERKRSGWPALLLLTIAFGAPSCASAPPRPETPESIAGLAAKRIVVLPLNIALALPQELKASAEIVSDALTEHLASHNKIIRPIDSNQGRALWAKATKEVSDSGATRSFENAIHVLARRIGEGAEFDALVVPAIYLQNARIRQDGVAFWDSATQEIEYVGQSRWKIELPPLPSIEAASILLYVFDPEGREIHSKRVGLELIEHLKIQISKRKGHDKRKWILAKDSPPIEDKRRVSAAVAHALYPFLAKKAPSSSLRP